MPDPAAIPAYAAAMSLTAPAWIAAIAALALAAGALTVAWYCRQAVAAQSRQHTRVAELLDLQNQQLRQLLDERRRAQASQVYIALDRSLPASVSASVHNASTQPAYDLYVIWQLGTVRMGKPDAAARLMPGQELCFERQLADDPEQGESVAGAGDAASLAAFLTFRDASGTRWTVREDGTHTDFSPGPTSTAD
jgi:hypothetical protein